MNTNWAVYPTVIRTVFWSVDEAARSGVGRTVYRNVYGDVGGDVSWVAHMAVFRNVGEAATRDPPHPALADFLVGTSKGEA